MFRKLLKFNFIGIEPNISRLKASISAGLKISASAGIVFTGVAANVLVASLPNFFFSLVNVAFTYVYLGPDCQFNSFQTRI